MTRKTSLGANEERSGLGSEGALWPAGASGSEAAPEDAVGSRSAAGLTYVQSFTSADADDAVFAFHVLRLIEESADGLSTRELTAVFGRERSLRDIRCALDRLREAGFAIKRTEGRWHCDAGAAFSGVELTGSEVLSIVLSDEDGSVGIADLGPVRERLRERLEARLTPEGRRWLAQLRVGLGQRAKASESGERMATRYPFSALKGQVYDYVVELEPQVAHIATDHVWHPTQRVHRLGNGGVYITFRAAGLVEVAAWIGSMGGRAQAVAPIELVAAVVELHCRGIERHRAGNVHLEDLRIPGVSSRRPPPTSKVLAKAGASMPAHALLPKLRSGS